MSGDGPMQRAQAAMRPPLPRRFYRKAGWTSSETGFVLTLDDRPARTPSRQPLAAPTEAVAAALAAEWDAQSEVIDPATMPLTRVINSIIDGVAAQRQAVAAEIARYIGSDLLCYRADAPPALVEQQRAMWDPVLDWLRDRFGLTLAVQTGIAPLRQPDNTSALCEAALPNDDFGLGACHVVTTLTGSAALALALTHQHRSADDVWAAAHIDEDFQIEHWGADEEAMARRAARRAEFDAAALILASRA